MNKNNGNSGLKVYKCSSGCIISRKKIPSGTIAVILEEFEDYFGVSTVRVLIDRFEGQCSKNYFFNHFYFLSTLNEYSNQRRYENETK
jgi:hypothetical protein